MAATILATAGTSRAGSDLDVFVAGNTVQPNVMIQFDNSGSMNDGVAYDHNITYAGPFSATTVYDRCQTFNTNCTCKRTQVTWKVHTSSCGYVDDDLDGQDDRAPSYVKIGNRRNYEATATVAKLQIAKSVIDGLLQDPANDQVRFGLMVLNGSYIPSDFSNASQVATYHNDKSVLKAVIGTAHGSLRTIVSGLTANSGTPLANRTIAAGRYFKHDGYFSGADPIQYTCQRNFLVIMTDGRPQAEGDTALGGSPFPLGGSNAIGEFNYIESWLGQPYDKNGDGLEADPAHFNPPPGCDVNSPDAEPCEYQNGGSDYLDDVCKVLLDQDLRPDLDGEQALITYTIGFDVANSLLQRCAAQGGGKYFTATTADELADAFRQTLNAIVSETESFVAPVVPVSQTTRTQSGDRLYIALFRPRDGSVRWPGNLKKYQVAESGQLLDANQAPATNADGDILKTAKSFWDTDTSGSTVTRGGVGELLKTRTAPRKIYTNLSGSDLTATGNLFTIGNSAITAATLAVGSAVEHDQVINYVHGLDVFDDDEDGIVTEKRDWILGDIIHSVPLVVNYTSSDAAVLIGSNDGMLHAFDDQTGDELWAFIPSDFLPRLKELLPGGSGSHPFFFDSSAKLRVMPNGQKIVVFGLGRGGRAYYALDVTDKTAPKFLWETTNASAGMSELGFTFSEPTFIKSASGTEVMIVGAGYDTYFDDPSHTTAHGSGGMGRGVYVLNTVTGALVSYLRPTYMDWAIPSNVAVLDVTGDGMLDRAYVGDLGGQMWRIDGDLTAMRLFSAPSGHKIFYAPDVVRDRGFLSVFFGTGDRSNPLETSVVDRMYGVKDDGTLNLTESNLVDVTTRLEQNGSTAEATLKDEIKNAHGWYIRLTAQPGEKALASPTAFFSVFFSTFTPVSGVCNAGGDARLYQLNYETGGIPDSGYEQKQTDDGSGGHVPQIVTITDRFATIGKSIPTELTVTLQKKKSSGFVASSGAVDQVPLPALPANVTPLTWRECSTEAPCP